MADETNEGDVAMSQSSVHAGDAGGLTEAEREWHEGGDGHGYAYQYIGPIHYLCECGGNFLNRDGWLIHKGVEQERAARLALVARIEKAADEWRCTDSPTHLASYCPECRTADAIASLLTADAPAALDAVKVKAAQEALREAADDPALRLSGHSGISITRLRLRADLLTTDGGA